MGANMVTYESIKHSGEVKTYIKKADAVLESIGYTEHSYAHVTKTAEKAGEILQTLGYSERYVELAKIAGYMHDIGNVVNRDDHAQSGAVMSFRILDKMGMMAGEIAEIICAIGNHDEGTAEPVSPIAAALILADKSDVRRTRVRNQDIPSFDIHDRVNYAVEYSDLHFSMDQTSLLLDLTIDTEISPVMNYFEIFLGRMMLCNKSAEKLGVRFELWVNDQKLL